MRIERLLCDRQSFIKSRAPLEDNAYVLSHYDNGAVGRLWAPRSTPATWAASATASSGPRPRSNGPTPIPTS